MLKIKKYEKTLVSLPSTPYTKYRSVSEMF